MKDPLTMWDGPFPYDVFADVGISPESTHADVKNVTYTLMRKNQLTQEAQAAWNELQLLDRRLFVDLFVYPGAAPDSGGDRDR
jgi:hypothetical protein